MECLNDDKMIKFRPDTLEAVRKELNLDKPGRISEALDILENWVQMQPHFVKKDFSRDYLERALITAKGLVERAKEKLDKLCTFKTLMPEFFNDIDIKRDLEPLLEFIHTAHMAHLTPQHHRVVTIKLNSENFESGAIVNYYKYLIMVSEYFMRVEYCAGFQIVMDYSEINILAFVTKINPLELRQIITLMTEGYGCRIKGIHVISSSKMVDALISLLKQVFSAKLAERIHLHKSAETLYEHIPKEVLSCDYGGQEKTVLEINKDWLETLGSKEFLNYMGKMSKANTDESCRQSDKFNEHYVGMPGSFRALSVD
ncbi:hypothetical protein PYW07_008294 [Mythimna separata]|uniref:CRAL-TRIO domain-containing protein n=1 Tax=Mythimna separata TaxID=271217 RepID=A0AAD7YDA0_MYTSE|nr:hypothetical protein PYW07_008294 [Mythimna separata]